MHRITALLAALFLLAGSTAQAKSLYWSSIDVDATLDQNGVLEVAETQGYVFDGDWNGGERRFDVRPSQSLELLGVERIDGTNVIPLRTGDLAEVDRYQLMDGNVLRWRSRLPSDPAFENTPLTYRIRYRLTNVLRGRDGQYRFAHDFLFPDRPGRVQQFSLRLTTDPAWGGIEPVLTRVSRDIPPGGSFIISRTLTWKGSGKPAGAITLPSPLPGRIMLVLLLAGIAALAFRFFAHEKGRGRFGGLTSTSEINDGWLETHIFGLSPEAVGAGWDGSVGAAEVAAAIAVLVQEKKIETSVVKRMLRRAKLTMRLLVDRDKLDGHRGAIARKLFFNNRKETDTDAIRKHYSGTGLDLAAFVSGPVEEELGQVQGWTEKVKVANWKLTIGLLIVSFIAMIVAGFRNSDDMALVMTALFLGLLALIGSTIAAVANRNGFTKMPLRLAVVFLFAMPLLLAVLGDFARSGDFLFGAPAIVTVALFVLAVFNLIFAALRSNQTGEKLAFRKKLLSARRYLREQLRSAQPRLKDEWFPYLLAFGLGENVESWFRAHGVAAGVADSGMSGSTSSSFGSSSSVSSTSSWTGGGGGFGGAGATGAWAVAASAMGAGVAAPSSSSGGGSSSSGSSSSSSSSSSSGGGGGGGW